VSDGAVRSFSVVVAVAAAVIVAGAAQSVGASSTPNAASKCVSRGGLPDLRCTPGARNRSVKQSTIDRTICVPNWTDTVRPPTTDMANR
jgi:hypothetical protein